MPKKRGMCVYCGKKEATERDHVPPKCFFPEPRPVRMITVPACSDCNRQEWNGSGEKIEKDEEYTRNIIIWEKFASQHPAAKRLLAKPLIGSAIPDEARGGAAYRSISADRRVNNQFKNTLKPNQTIRTKGGLWIPGLTTLRFDSDRIGRCVRKIIRGLYFYETSLIFPEEYEINIFVLSLIPYLDRERANIPVIRTLLDGLTMPGPRRLGDGIFSYQMVQSKPEIDPALTIWVMSFYDGVVLSAVTFRPGEGTVTVPKGERVSNPGIVLARK